MDNVINILNTLMERYPALESCRNNIKEASEFLISSYSKGGKLLICGNGGSAADADHIAGELLKGFTKKRKLNAETKKKLLQINPTKGEELGNILQESLPAISLTAHTALKTAVINDLGSEFMFAQQVLGYAQSNDILLGISTSGNAQNVINALITAKSMGIKTIGLSGESGGKMKEYCDISLNVPGKVTHEIQELHMPLYHTLCIIIEDHFFQN